MTSEEEEDTATSLSELECPDCGAKGLSLIKEHAARYDSYYTKVQQASGCRTEGCRHYYRADNPIPIPSHEIAEDYSPGVRGRFKNLTSTLQDRSVSKALRKRAMPVLLTTIIAGFLIAAILSIGVLLNGGVVQGDTGFEKVDTIDGWVIYQNDGQYLISGNYDGDIRYLGPNVSISDSPHFFSSEQDARAAISQWQDAHAENPEQFPSPGSENDIYPAADIWQLFERDGSFLVSGVRDGNVIYLHPNATVKERPHVYDSRADAEAAILEWLAQNQENDTNIRPTSEEELVGDAGSSDGFNWSESSLTVEGYTPVKNYNSSLRTTETDFVVQGRLYTSDGAPMSNATVEIHSTPRTVQTNEHGEYVFTNVSEGSHTLSASPKNNSESVAPSDVNLRVRSDGQVSVTNSSTGAIYFEDGSSAVLNRISLKMQDSEQVYITGKGQNLTSNITIYQENNARDYEVTFTSAYNSSLSTETIYGKSNSDEFLVEGNEESKTTFLSVRANETVAYQDIDGSYTAGDPNPTVELLGNKHPEDATITLFGQYNTTDVTLTGDSNTVRTVDIGGSVNPVGGSKNNEPVLTIYGSNRTEPFSRTRTDISSYEYTETVPGNKNPINTEIRLSGNTLIGSKQSQKVGYQGTVEVGGNIDPSGTTATFYPVTELTDQSVSGTGTETVTVSGNMDPEASDSSDYPKITITGREATSERSISGSGSGSVTNNGNIDSNAEITLTGSESTEQQTASGTGSGTITNNGNVNANGNIVVTGNTRSLGAQSTTGTVNDDGTITIDVDGNTPTNVQLQLTGESEETYLEYIKAGCSRSERSSRFCIGYGDTWERYSESVKIHSNAKHRIEWMVRAKASEDKIKINSDLYWPGGHAGAEANCVDCSDTNREEYTGTDTFKNSAGDRITAKIGMYDDDGIGAGKARARLYRIDGPGSTEVLVDSNPVTSKHIGPSQTRTFDLGKLEPGTHKIKIDTESGVGTDFSASWEEKESTSGLSIDTDEDGVAEVTHAGVMANGDSVETGITLRPGTTEVDISSNGPAPDWDATYTEVTATSNLNADLNGDGTDDISRTTPLRDDQSVTREVSMNPGSNTVSVDHSGPDPGWSGSIWETNATQNPTVTVNQESTTTGEILTEGETVALRISSLEAGENTIELSTTSGPKPVWTIYYTTNSTTKNPTVDVDGDGDVDATHSGAITSPTTVDLNGLSPGDNQITSGSGSGPTPQVRVTFKNRTATENPSASVGGETISHTGILRQGDTATFDLSKVDRGENTVSVSTDAGRVDYTLSGDSVYLLEDPGVDYDSDALNDAGYQGTLSEGESVTVEAGDLRHGTHDLDFNSEVNQIEYELSYTERNVTKTPSFGLGGVTTCKEPGITGAAQECDVPVANLSTGDNQVNLSTVNGSVNYEIEYKAVTVPQKASATVNGTTYEYPADFNGSDKLSQDYTRGATRTISSLHPGIHTTTISSEPVDDLDTAVDVQVAFSNRSYRSESPQVQVENSEEGMYNKTVPDTALAADGRLVGQHRMTLQEDWLTEGQNTIRIQSGGESVVNATLRGFSLRNQTREFSTQAGG